MYVFSQFSIDFSEAKTCTVVLCKCYKPHLKKIEATLRDAIMFAATVSKGKVVVGGGAIEMELSKKLRDRAKEKVDPEVKALIEAISVALEIIPRQLCENADLDATKILKDLRQKHNSIGKCGKIHWVQNGNLHGIFFLDNFQKTNHMVLTLKINLPIILTN